MLRQALRTLVRAPMLSAVIVLSIGLGVGANTVVFSWISWPSRQVRDAGMKKAMDDPRV